MIICKLEFYFGINYQYPKFSQSERIIYHGLCGNVWYTNMLSVNILELVEKLSRIHKCSSDAI